MSDTAIADIGEILRKLLTDRMQDLNSDEIVLGSPGEINDGDNVRLSLFLYQVLENIHLRNQEMKRIDSTTAEYPPLILDLFYMLTSHPSAQNNNRTDRTLDEYKILGRAMQIFQEKTILTGSDFVGKLDKTMELHLALNPLSLDDLTKIWNTFQGRPFRPSVCYLVTPVEIKSSRSVESLKRVISKQAKYYVMIPEREEK